jgi:hypothetical protein
VSPSDEPVSEVISTNIDSEASDSDDLQPTDIASFRKKVRLQRVLLQRKLRIPRLVGFVDVVREVQNRASKYTHQPLDDGKDIRLLVVHPGTGNEVIYCHLEQAVFPRKDTKSITKRYTALSYFWGLGTDDPNHEIRILDPWSGKRGTPLLVDIAWKIGRHNLGKPFYIRPNLFNALRQLRSSKTDCSLMGRRTMH